MKPIPPYWTLALAVWGVLLLFPSCAHKKVEAPVGSLELLPDLEGSLKTLAQVWYPRAVDSIHGGYWSDFNAQWDLDGPQDKMIVSQARHLWTTARLALFYKDEQYEHMAAHGYRFLRDRMWDTTNGGFYTLMKLEGDSLIPTSKGKSAYGNSFAIYALATYYKASQDTTALHLAIKTFHWLEHHSHDAVFKGYFDVLLEDGSWLLGVDTNDQQFDNFIRKDWKDQNSTIHLLESFTALYEVWPDPLLKTRLEELLVLVRDTITTEVGSLTLHLQRDWTPVSLKDSSEAYRKTYFWLDHISFGHDVETAFLMLEASHGLGLKNDSVTAKKAKKMVDHGIEKGWDDEKGGFFDAGYYFEPKICTIVNPAKIWWTEAEGLNSLLLMAELYPEEKHYYQLFEKQWAYIDTYMVDHEYGGWHHEGLDTRPYAKEEAKAHIWKTNYHNIRSLINVVEMLKGKFPLTRNDVHQMQ